jgi:histone acetyltransferase (RNA polymerase elongator complex component)
MKNKVLPVFLPFEGCSNKCIFCNQNSITKISDISNINEVELQIKKYLNYSKNWEQIAFYGGSFSCLDKKRRQQFYDLAKKFEFKSIRFSTRPDCIDKNMVKEFVENNVDTIELGVQSLNDDVLKLNNRSYLGKDVVNTINILKNEFYIVAQLMPGIYGESFGDFAEGIKKLEEFEIDAVRLYPCIVLRNTKLQILYEKKIYKPLELWEAIMLAGFAYTHFESKGIKVIRMGLPIDSNDDAIVAGPIQNAFSDVVKTYILLLYCEISNENVKLPVNLSGYKSVVRRSFPNKFAKKTENVAWKYIISEVKEYFFEDSKWYLQRQTIKAAKKLQSETYNR